MTVAAERAGREPDFTQGSAAALDRALGWRLDPGHVEILHVLPAQIVSKVRPRVDGGLEVASQIVRGLLLFARDTPIANDHNTVYVPAGSARAAVVAIGLVVRRRVWRLVREASR